MLGDKAMEKLAASRVAVFGIGGVGGYTVEALARAGVGALDLIDDDKVSITNINRQIIATHDSIGRYKVDVAQERIHAINPQCVVTVYKTFYLPETADVFDFTQYDYIIDAIDTVSGKLALVQNAQSANTPIMSSMGAGNKLDAGAFKVADIYKTSVCPLARVMRYECKKRGIKHLKVVYSTEKPICPLPSDEAEIIKNEYGNAPHERKFTSRRQIPGSVSFAPAVAGLMIAGEVVKDLVQTV